MIRKKSKKKRPTESKFKFLPFSKRQLHLINWWLHPKYKNMKMVIADGSIRSGKTVCFIFAFVQWAIEFAKENPDEEYKFILAARTKGSLKRNVIDILFQILNTLGIEYKYYKNNEDPHIQIGKNIKLYPFGGNDESAFEKLRGFTSYGAYCDEVSLFPESFFNEVISRCSPAGSKIWISTNPDNPNHWLYEKFILKRKEKGILRLHCTLEDNPALSEEAKENYRKMYNGLFYQRMILGLWVMADGVVYDNFDKSIHVIDCPKDFACYFVSADFGMGNPTVFLLWGIANGGKAYLIREYHYAPKSDTETGEIRKQKSVGELAQDLKGFLKGIRPEAVYIDPSARVLSEEIKRLGYHVVNAQNDQLPGIVYTQNCLDQGFLFIDKSCKETIKEFMAYIWDKKLQNQGEDKPVKANDHCMDALRYFLYTYHRKLYKVGYLDRKLK